MNGRKSFRRSDLEKLFDIQNDEKRSPSNIGGTGEKMGFGDDEFSISPAGSLSIIPCVSGESEIHPPSGGMENVLV